MTQLICLANSWKHGDRCIAGINPTTGQWIRPISALENGQIPPHIRLIQQREPALLDILEVPLTEHEFDNRRLRGVARRATPLKRRFFVGAGCARPNEKPLVELTLTEEPIEFARENRLMQSGVWRKIGRVQPEALLPYCQQGEFILHNTQRYVLLSYLQSLPFSCRQTIQLVKAVTFSARISGQRLDGSEKWEGRLFTETGLELTARITDPLLVRRLELDCLPKLPCLVTVSLSLPWVPPDWAGEEQPCWKLIAGLIEL
jgi:hypothetical protein